MQLSELRHPSTFMFVSQSHNWLLRTRMRQTFEKRSIKNYSIVSASIIATSVVPRCRELNGFVLHLFSQSTVLICSRFRIIRPIVLSYEDL